MAATRLAAPDEVELGEALKHLSAEERARIVEVMRRAKQLDDDQAQRAREIEKDYISFTANVLQKQASIDSQMSLCPICCHQIVDPGKARSEELNACGDCERVVCSDCGSFETSMKTKLKEWVCHVCSKRRQYVISSGVWISTPANQRRDSFRKKSTSMGDYEVVLPCVSGSGKDDAQPTQLASLPAKQQLRRTDSLPIELDCSKARHERPNHLDLTPDADGRSAADAAPSSTSAATASARHVRPHETLHRLLPPVAADKERSAAAAAAPALQPRLRRSVGTDFSKGAFDETEDGSAAAAVASRVDLAESYDSDDDSLRGDGGGDDDEEVEYLTDALAAGAGKADSHAGHFGANDWSPAMDLSPIEDVSPTIELEAEADWLAYQTTRARRQPLAAAAPAPTIEGSAGEARAGAVPEEINNNSLPHYKLVESPSGGPLTLVNCISDQRSVPCLESQSTTESGYESQSMGRVSDAISCVDRKSLDESKAAGDRDWGCTGERIDAFDASSTAGYDAADDGQYGTDVDDGFPDVPESVTFNIYAGRNMFRSTAAAAGGGDDDRPPPGGGLAIVWSPPPPVQLPSAATMAADGERRRPLSRRVSDDAESSVAWTTAEAALADGSPSRIGQPGRRAVDGIAGENYSSGGGSGWSRRASDFGLEDADTDTDQQHYERAVGAPSTPPPPLPRPDGRRGAGMTSTDSPNADEDKSGNCFMPGRATDSKENVGLGGNGVVGCARTDRDAFDGCAQASRCSDAAAGTNRKPPVPLPRLSKLRSLDSDEAASVGESDEEIVEVKFSAGDVASITRVQSQRNKEQLSKTRSAGEIDTGSLALSAALSSPTPPTLYRDASANAAAWGHEQRQRQLEQHAELLRRSEADKKEIALDLERRLEEIKKLEERQRAILQRTLMNVVRSAQESSQSAATTQPPDSPRASGRNLAPPSAAAPGGGGGNGPRLSPQSPRKATTRSSTRSEPGGGLKFSPISENGDYSFRDWIGESPVLHRRTQSNHSLLSNDTAAAAAAATMATAAAAAAAYGGRDARLAGSYSSLVGASSSDSLQRVMAGEALLSARCRLSSSYTELQQHASSSSSRDSPERSGYFSDRECERRKAPTAAPGGHHAPLGGGAWQPRDVDAELQMAYLQGEIERRQRQLEQNIRLRDELQQLCRLAVLPLDDYERVRQLYRDHVTHSRSYYEAAYAAAELAASSAVAASAPYTSKSGDRAAATAASQERSPQAVAANAFSSAAASSQPPKRQEAGAASTPNRLGAAAADGGDDDDYSRRTDAVASAATPAMPLLGLRSPATRSRPTSAGSDSSSRTSKGPEELLSSDVSESAQMVRAGGGVAALQQQQQQPAEKSEPKVQVRKWSFPTKRILVIPKQNKGPCIEISGGLPIADDEPVGGADHVGAFVANILSDSIESQLHGELKKGDEILEWNGVCLRDRSHRHVQEIVTSFVGEIEMVVKEAGQRGSARSTLRRSPSVTEPTATPPDRQPAHPAPTTKTPESAAVDSAAATPQNASKRVGAAAANADAGGAKGLRSEISQPQSATSDGAAQRPPKSSSGAASASRAAAQGPAATKQQPGQTGKNPARRAQAPPPLTPAATQPGASTTAAAATGNGTMAKTTTSPLSPPVTKVGNGTLAGCAADAGHAHKTASHGDSKPAADGSHHPAPHPERTTPPSKKPLDCGEVSVSFTHDKNRQQLTTRVESASGLAILGKEMLNPFVKIHFIRNDKIEEKRCTRYIEKTCSPAWKQSFTFGVTDTDLPQYKVRLSAWDYHLPKQNLFVGSVVVALSGTHAADGALRSYKLESGTAERRRIESARTSPTTSGPAGSHARTVRFSSEGSSSRQRAATTSRE